MSIEKAKQFVENKVNSGINTNALYNDLDGFKSKVTDGINDLKNTAKGAVGEVSAYANTQLAKLKPKFLNFKSLKQADVIVQDSEKDWRLRLGLPKRFRDSIENDTDLMAPLIKTNGFVFPYTPTVLVSQSANYQSIQPVHTNYPYYSYQNSQVDQMTITGDFYVQNAAEARYWVACIHYLRSATKMNFGVDQEAGQPPPVVRLDGYGDFVFNNVPVIINSFQFDMPKDVDYISTSVGTTQVTGDFDPGTSPTSWAPATSILTVAVTPQYSRTTQSEFSLSKFMKGGYLSDRSGFI